MKAMLIALGMMLLAPAVTAQTAEPLPAPAPAPEAAPVAEPPARLSRNRRDAAVQVCMIEAEKRGKALGATSVTLDEVEDTDELSDNRTWVRIEVKLRMVDANGRKKTIEKTAKCKTQASVVTDFEW